MFITYRMRKFFFFLITIILLAFSSGASAQQRDSTQSEVHEDLERALENFDPEETQGNS
ncbi:MAG: hypothetical protein U5K69_16205 [Balneolaceae bacterium]|nr:hypothetical protein [Balneolaceae bacterium]